MTSRWTSGATRVVLMCLTTAAVSYLATDLIYERLNRSPKSGDRVAVAAESARTAHAQPLPGVTVCPTLVVQRLPADLIARTKFRTREAVSQFLEQHGAAYDELRRHLLPELFTHLAAVRTCYKQQTNESAMAELSFRIRATRIEARASDVAIEQMVGSDEQRPFVQRCLAELSRDLAVRVTAPDNVQFPPYDDLYLNHIPLPLGNDWRPLAKLLPARDR